MVSCMVEMHKNKPFESFTNLLGIMSKYFEADKIFCSVMMKNKLSNVFEWNNNGVNRAEELKAWIQMLLIIGCRPMSIMKMLFEIMSKI